MSLCLRSAVMADAQSRITGHGRDWIPFWKTKGAFSTEGFGTGFADLEDQILAPNIWVMHRTIIGAKYHFITYYQGLSYCHVPASLSRLQVKPQAQNSAAAACAACTYLMVSNPTHKPIE